MIEKDLYAALKTVCPRVYPMFMPDDAVYPSITYQVVFSGTEQSVSGNVCGKNTRFQVDIYAKSYSEAKSLRDEAISKIVDLSGGDISSHDLYEDTVELHRQMIDFKIKE